MKKAKTGYLKAFLLGIGMIFTLTVGALIGADKSDTPVIIVGDDDDIKDVHKRT